MTKVKYETPKELTFWMLARPNGEWVGDGEQPYVYKTRMDAAEAGWNYPTNPCRPVKVRIKILLQG